MRIFGQPRRFAEPFGLLAGGAAATLAEQLIIAGVDVIWWAGDDVFTDTGLTTPAADGNDVAGWKDQGSSAYHLTEATTKPVLDSDGINLKPALVYTSANTDKLKRSVAGIVANRTVYNVYAVYKSSATALQAIYAEGSTTDALPFAALRMNLGAAGRISWQHRQDGGAVIAQINATPTPAANNGNRRLVTARRIVAGSFDLRVDGTSIGTDSASPGTTTVDRIGAGVAPGAVDGSYFNGSIALIAIAYTDVYTAVEPILAAYYDITLPP